MISSVRSLIVDAPALVSAVVVAVLTLLVTFGVPISADQRAAISGLTGAILALVGGLYVHGATTPNAHVDAVVKAVQAPNPSAADTPPAVEPVTTG